MRGLALVMLAGLTLTLTLGLMSGPVKASLYSPDDSSFNLPVSADGKAQAFDYEKRFKTLLAKLNNALDERKIDGKDVNEDRRFFLGRIKKSEEIKNPSADDLAERAGLLLRVGELDRAINLLIPRTRDPRPSYFVFITLGQLYATRGGDQWTDALRYHEEGLLDTEMPPTIKGLTPAQRNWVSQLDNQYLPHYYRIGKHDAELRRGKPQAELDRMIETEEVLPLFPLPRARDEQKPVRFVNEAGVYQPGQLAAAERAKLPDDAIAIVQQLILWFPRDARLYWLLAELYAASGQFRTAAELFERCSWSLQFSKRKIMMDHRAAVMPLAAKEKSEEQPLLASGPAETTTPAEAPSLAMRDIWYYFGAIGLVVAFALARTILRRTRTSPAK